MAGHRREVSHDEVWNALQSDPVFPEGADKSRRRNIRLVAKSFNIDHGLLFRKSGDKRQQWITDERKQQEILQSCHSHPTSGHLGRDRTRKKICERFYWRGMYDDVDKFVQKCLTCQKTDRTLKKTGVLHSIPVEPRFWARIGVDLIGPMVETARGNKYIFTCTDAFSKWPEAFPDPSQDKTARAVADCIFRLFCRHGCCEVQITDQGREFVNQISERLHELCGVQHRITSAYHPQSNGQTERFNRTLVDTLRKITVDEEDWDTVLDAALFAYRTTVQKSTGMTPFKMVYGKEARLPVDVEQGVGGCMDEDDKDDWTSASEGEHPSDLQKQVERMIGVLRQVHSTASDNIKKSQEMQKKYYDKRHAPLTFKIGDVVFLRNSREDGRKGGKMKLPWSGPYEVITITKKGLYKLQNLSSAIKLSAAVNGSRLKLATGDSSHKRQSQKEADDKGDAGGASDTPESQQPPSDPGAAASKPQRADVGELNDTKDSRPTSLGNLKGRTASKGAHIPRTTRSRTKYWLKDLLLFESDHDDLVHGRAVSDAIIYAACCLVKKSCPDVKGLEPTLFAEQLRFTPMPSLIEGEQSLQVHHDGCFHWLVSQRTSVDTKVHLYDSLQHGRPGPRVGLQLAAIYGQDAQPDSLHIVMEPAQQQQGGTDCGLFAVAVATELAFGGDPLLATFDQRQMRNHLQRCFESGEITPFPKSADTAKRCARTVMAIDLHCMCRMPQEYDEMVMCSKCGEVWCHISCLGIPKSPQGFFYCWICLGKPRPKPVKRPPQYDVPTPKKRKKLY